MGNVEQIRPLGCQAACCGLDSFAMQLLSFLTVFRKFELEVCETLGGPSFVQSGIHGRPQSLRWPYGFRFEWATKLLYTLTDVSGDDRTDVTIRLKPAAPPIREVIANIPEHMDDQLGGILICLTNFKQHTDSMHISRETKNATLQRTLTDMAENVRDSVLAASSWFRQKALEFGPGYVDASLAHYLYLSLIGGLSTELSQARKTSRLTHEWKEWKKRRMLLGPTAIKHVSNTNSVAIADYLNRAEMIRELLIYANKQICLTVSAKEDVPDTAIDYPNESLADGEKDTYAEKLVRLNHCKRIASIIQLHVLRKQNNWSLVTCHVQIDDSSGEPRLFDGC